MVSLEERDRLEREPSSPIPMRPPVHRPIEEHQDIPGPTMQELLRAAARNSGWAESIQPLRDFESNIASRFTSQAHQPRDVAHPLASFESNIISRLASQANEAREGPRGAHQPPLSPFQPGQRPWGEAGDFRGGERPAPRLWSERHPSSHTSRDSLQSLMSLGPIASDLALMIQNSQRVQQFMDQGASPQEAQRAAHEEIARTGLMHANPGLVPLLEQLQHHAQAQRLPSWEGLRAPPPPFGGHRPPLGDGRGWAPQGPLPGPRPSGHAFDVYQPPPQMSEAAQNEFLRSLHMLQEAQRLAAQGTSQLQEMYGSSGVNSQRKRKITEASNALTQSIGEALAEGEGYAQKPSIHQGQQCSLCGASSTPVWRRLNKALVCNACGLKRRRSAKVAASKGEASPGPSPPPSTHVATAGIPPGALAYLPPPASQPLAPAARAPPPALHSLPPHPAPTAPVQAPLKEEPTPAGRDEDTQSES